MLWFTSSVFSQKQPSVQIHGVKAPEKVKIDGDKNEWQMPFQAYNKAIEVFYTIANNNDKLYLVIKANKPEIIKKIIMGGVSLRIGHAKNNNTDYTAITFPFADKQGMQNILAQIKKAPKNETDTIVRNRKRDSLRMVSNKLMANNLKTIKVKIKDVADTVISIYNEYQIQAAAKLDNENNYICEIGVPLKYLILNANDAKIHYTIQLNGANINDINPITVSGFKGVVVNDGVPSFLGPAANEISGLTSPTNMRGEYELIK